MKIKQNFWVFAALAVFVFAVSISGLQAGAIINFDDLATPNTDLGHWGTIPASYQGFSWDGFEVADATYYKTAYGNSYQAPSMNNFAYNGSGIKTVTVTDELFSFIGADFSTWAQCNTFVGFSAQSVTITGYHGASIVGSQTISLPSTGFVTQSLNFNGIDKLEFLSNDSGKWWAMDNFEYWKVPEPALLLLLTISLSGVALVEWRRRK
jgi:hypothetical protein